MSQQREHGFQCPYCGERISVLLEPADTDQLYTEDCEVCCNPMLIKVAPADEGEQLRVTIQREND